ncbi:MAG: hypothetical protein ACPGUC_08270, partial [Gammaproteobacteria bacterium]
MKMTPLRLATVVLVATTGVLEGCSSSRVYYVHREVSGLDAAIQTSPASGRFTLGYDSSSFAYVPKGTSNEEQPKEGGKKISDEAVSVVSCTRLREGDQTEGTAFDMQFSQTMATG